MTDVTLPVEGERSEAPELDHDAIGFEDGLGADGALARRRRGPSFARRGLETAPDDRV